MNEFHGNSNTTEYYAWVAMRRRCYSEKCHAYKGYGGRGITVCDRWRYSFPNFLEDIGTKPSPELSLERRNNNEGYSPDNCHWGTPKEQSDNRRIMINTSNTSETKNIYYIWKKWEVIISMSCFGKGHRIRQRFVTLDEAKEFRDEIAYEKMFHRQLGLR